LVLETTSKFLDCRV